jgi:hypothetical protein
MSEHAFQERELVESLAEIVEKVRHARFSMSVCFVL